MGGGREAGAWGRGGLLLACLVAAGGAHASAQERLRLDPPQFAEGGGPGPVPAAALDAGPSQAKLGWLAFGADALFEAGVTATEVGFGAFGWALLTPASGVAVGSLVFAGLVLVIHPFLDAMIVNAAASLSRRFRPSYLAALGGASIGCLLGTLGAIAAMVGLAAWPAAEWIVATLANALLPAAGAVIGEWLGETPIPVAPAQPSAAPTAAVASVEVPVQPGLDLPALAAAQSTPLLRWAL